MNTTIKNDKLVIFKNESIPADKHRQMLLINAMDTLCYEGNSHNKGYAVLFTT